MKGTLWRCGLIVCVGALSSVLWLGLLSVLCVFGDADTFIIQSPRGPLAASLTCALIVLGTPLVLGSILLAVLWTVTPKNRNNAEVVTGTKTFAFCVFWVCVGCSYISSVVLVYNAKLAVLPLLQSYPKVHLDGDTFSPEWNEHWYAVQLGHMKVDLTQIHGEKGVCLAPIISASHQDSSNNVHKFWVVCDLMIHSLRPCAHLVSANKDALPDSRQHPAFKCLISWHQQLDGGVVIRSSNRGLDHSIERMLWRNHLAPSTAGMANTNLTEWKKENVLLLWTDVASSSERSQLVCGLCLVIHVVAVVILSTLIHFCLWHDNIKPATSSYFLLPQM